MNTDLEKENIKQNNFVGFIPRRLEIKGREELAVFSLNFLMGRYIMKEGKLVLASALYEPDLSSFQVIESPKSLTMNYYNKRDRRARLLMKIDFENKKRECVKYFEEEETGITVGAFVDGEDKAGGAWKNFFFHMGYLGFAEGEVVEFTDMEGKN